MAPTLQNLLDRLADASPESPVADQFRQEVEHALMKTLQKAGLQGLERSVARLNVKGCAFTAELREGPSQAWCRSWRASFDDACRALEVFAIHTGDMQTMSVQYRDTTPRRLNARQTEQAGLQEAIYARYNQVAARAYAGDRAPRLMSADRLILLVAELEADVNNGGFGQYLANKGRRRARSALRALERIGAKRTYRMLEQALSANVSTRRLEQLDGRFYKSSEDLAVLTMKHTAASHSKMRKRRAAHQGDEPDEAR